MVRVKICGITMAEDALMAAEYGADALGFIFYKKSPRYVEPGDAAAIIKELPPFVTTVGVFVDETPEEVNRIVEEAGLDRAQLHGSETPEECERVKVPVIKVLRVKEPGDVERLSRYHVSAFLLDTFREGTPGGTGETFDWSVAVKAGDYGRVILSGGLKADNVREAVARTLPYGVDVSTGVESAPGHKDPEKVMRFIEEAKGV